MKKDIIQLSDHFNYRRLLRFTLPSILMLVFTSVYTVTDGFFVSNFVGKTPFAAVNFIYPLLMILGCAGFMFGTGGGALIAKTMGVGDQKKANGLFSLIVYTASACAHQHGDGRRWGTFREQHPIWANYFAAPAVLYPAVRVPMPVLCCRKAAAWPLCHSCRRPYQYGIRRIARSRFPLRTCRSGSGDGYQPVRRRHFPAHLFRAGK